jgi:hypothetical protein
MTGPPNLKSKIGVDDPSHADSKVQFYIDPRLQQAIAHWEFDAQAWQRFLEVNETKRYDQDIKVAFVILTIIALVMGILYVLGAREAVCGVGIFGGIILLTVIAHFLIQRRRYQGMGSYDAGRGGDVYITPKGIWANGVWFDWGDGTPWRLSTVTPVLTDTGVRLPPGDLSYIEFKCRGRAAGRFRVKVEVDKKWRVPVPRGKEGEAREVVRYFGKPSAVRDKFGLPDD